jgi:hypothetical protein
MAPAVLDLHDIFLGEGQKASGTAALLLITLDEVVDVGNLPSASA